MFSVALLPELREHIVSFLGPWDEIASFSLTCHQAVETVEAYSRSELDRIERQHDVDDTWRFRVGMQAAQDVAERLSSEGQEGVMLVPNTVSHRRMLRSAYRTHLYSLGTMPSRDWTSLLALSMHPNGKYLLSGGQCDSARDRSVRLWDLSTKQCIKSFIGHEKSVTHVGFSAGHVVSSSGFDRKLRIWSMDGVCKHVVSLPEGRIARTLAVSNDMVYLMDMSGPIYVINTMAGAVTSMEQPWDDSRTTYSVDLRVCKNYLLCMRNLEDVIDDNERLQNGLGIYVFDRDSMDVRSYLAGSYRSVASTPHGDVAIITSRGQIQVYQLRDGSLVRHLSVPCPGDHIEVLYMTESTMFVTESHIGTQQTRITVYSSINGMVERRLCYPTVDRATGIDYFPWAMASNGREVFVGFNVGGYSRAGGTVKAFLL